MFKLSKWIILAVLVALVAGVVLLAGCQGEATPATSYRQPSSKSASVSYHQPS